jgi:hypothetical protein
MCLFISFKQFIGSFPTTVILHYKLFFNLSLFIATEKRMILINNGICFKKPVSIEIQGYTLPPVLYSCKTWTLTLREGSKLQECSKNVFRKLSGECVLWWEEGGTAPDRVSVAGLILAVMNIRVSWFFVSRTVYYARIIKMTSDMFALSYRHFARSTFDRIYI